MRARQPCGPTTSPHTSSSHATHALSTNARLATGWRCDQALHIHLQGTNKKERGIRVDQRVEQGDEDEHSGQNGMSLSFKIAPQSSNKAEFPALTCSLRRSGMVFPIPPLLRALHVKCGKEGNGK